VKTEEARKVNVKAIEEEIAQKIGNINEEV
jgi:hypothetical protein